MSAETADTSSDGDVTDPAYWCDPKFKVVAIPQVVFSKLLCGVATCGGTAYYDGAGSYVCQKCGRAAM